MDPDQGRLRRQISHDQCDGRLETTASIANFELEADGLELSPSCGESGDSQLPKNAGPGTVYCGQGSSTVGKRFLRNWRRYHAAGDTCAELQRKQI